MPLYEYRIESSYGDERWKVAYQWKQDDPWVLSDFDVTVINAQVGFFFRMAEYGVSMDSGNSWKVFNVYEALKERDYGKIYSRFDHAVPRVKMGEDGNGEIYMQSYYDRNGPTYAVYRTGDFGQTWNPIGTD